jgi:hypothetical protein
LNERRKGAGGSGGGGGRLRTKTRVMMLPTSSHPTSSVPLSLELIKQRNKQCVLLNFFVDPSNPIPEEFFPPL